MICEVTIIPDAKDVKPKVRGQSDFFSWQLHRFLKKFPQKSQQRIWAATWNAATGFDGDQPNLYIGAERDGEWIHARQLRNLCLKGSDLQRYAYGLPHGTADWVDVTDEFWADYMVKGICAIHGDYAHQWDGGEKERICQRCQKQESKRVIMEPREVWESA